MFSKNFYSAVILLVSIAAITGLPYNNRQRREVFVDGNGFFLGGGANNNLREASQLFDLGGPIVNPWLNPWTQPLPRGGFITAPSPIPVPVGPEPVPVPGPAPAPAPEPTPVPAPQQTFAQQPQQTFAQQPQQTFAQQPQQGYGQVQQQTFLTQQSQPQGYGQQQVFGPQQQQQQAYGGAVPQQTAFVPQGGFLAQSSGGYGAPTPVAVAPQPTFVPAQAYNSPIMQTYNAPQPQPQFVQQQQQQNGYGAPQFVQPQPVQLQQQQQGGYGGAAVQQSGFLAPAPVAQTQQVFSAPATASIQGVSSSSSDNNQKPFTAVFIPGEQTKFKLGLPHDYNTGQYTSI